MALQGLDPTISESIALIDVGDLDDETLAGLRVEFSLPVADSIEWEDLTVPGDPDVIVRTYRSKGPATGPAPCIYSMHGGGYVLGSREIDNALFAEWCPDLGVIGVSVEYRLAPETPYPGPLEDCYRGLAFCVEHADELGIDPTRIGVAGISAGGGLAAALALLARDRGEISLAFQLLDCPMLDDRQVTESSQLDGLPVWTRRSNEFGWRSYLGDLYGRPDVPATAAPARASDLSGLPAAFVSVGTVDGFRDEDIEYATRLNQAGVPTELHVYPGLCHGYHIAVDSPAVVQARLDATRWLRRQLEGKRSASRRRTN
jgi:acetyl esterase/lipase